jgi:20S proteasome subunit beta 1
MHRCAQYTVSDLLFRTDALSRQTSGPPSVHTAAALFQKLCYENKDALSAGIIVGGWDEQVGPSVYNIPLGGGMFRQPWAIGGMLWKCKPVIVG